MTEQRQQPDSLILGHRLTIGMRDPPLSNGTIPNGAHCCPRHVRFPRPVSRLRRRCLVREPRFNAKTAKAPRCQDAKMPRYSGCLDSRLPRKDLASWRLGVLALLAFRLRSQPAPSRTARIVARVMFGSPARFHTFAAGVWSADCISAPRPPRRRDIRDASIVGCRGKTWRLGALGVSNALSTGTIPTGARCCPRHVRFARPVSRLRRPLS